MGSAATYLGALVYMLKSAAAAGLPESEQTKGMVSSLWVVADCIGGYVGSSVGGLAYDQVGFRAGTLLEVFIMSASLVFVLAFLAWRWWRGGTGDGEEEGEEEREEEEERKRLLNYLDKEERVYGT